MNSRLQQDPAGGDTTIIMRFLRPPNFNYTYFGIQDNGTTGNIIRMHWWDLAPVICVSTLLQYYSSMHA